MHVCVTNIYIQVCTSSKPLALFLTKPPHTTSPLLRPLPKQLHSMRSRSIFQRAYIQLTTITRPKNLSLNPKQWYAYRVGVCVRVRVRV